MTLTNNRRGARRAIAFTIAAACAVVAGPLAVTAHAAARSTVTAPAPTVSVFPRPGTQEASPTTTLSFRDIAPTAIGNVSVRGAISGLHTGSWTAHSDGRGASFTPTKAFVPGEEVTVQTHLAVRDAHDGAFTFYVAHPSTVTKVEDPTDDLVPYAPNGATAATAPPTSQSYHSRPDLHPPTIAVHISKPGTAPGYLAITPLTTEHRGPLLVDNAGQVVWDRPESLDDFVTDAKVVHYQGNDDLAWWHGTFEAGFGEGEYRIVDHDYRQIATVHAGNGFNVDLHDMEITPQNTALILAYNPVAEDLSPYGGPVNGTVLEIVVQEIDIATGSVLFEWHSLDDVPLSKSVQPLSGNPQVAWDYMHGNAVELDSDGKILVSGRHTSAIYKIDRTSGHVVWTLGKGGDFTPSFPVSDWFANQHDVRRWPDHTLTVFDNGSGAGPDTRQYSRGLVLSLNETNHTVAIVRSVRAPTDVKASSQGSFRQLPGGNQIIGWGQVGEITEYNHAGDPLLDLLLPSTYRAMRVVWHGTPTTPPDLAVTRDGTTVHAYASWNGATEVASWTLRAGPDLAHLTTVATAPRSGFETTITGTTSAPVLVVEAHAANNALLGSTSSVYQHRSGYWLARNDGAVAALGAAIPYGSATVHSFRPVVGMAPAAGGGYWVAQSDGSVTAVSTKALGSLAGRHLNAPIVGIAPTPDGTGFWLASADGGVFRFGSATFQGSLGNARLNAPIVGISATPDGHGYRLVASDGGVFTFGGAPFAGSLGNRHLNAPIVGIAATGDSKGYWLVAADGGVFRFGSAPFEGSLGGAHRLAPTVGMATTGDSKGYWLVGADGVVFTFGDAIHRGSAPAGFAPVVAIAAA